MYRARIAVTGVLLAACVAGPPQVTDQKAAESDPVPTHSRLAEPISAEPALPTPTNPITTGVMPSQADHESLVASAAADVAIYPAPGAPLPGRTVEATTILGTPTVFLVAAGPIDGWVKLALPGRPNQATGWARVEQFELRVVDQKIHVDLSDRTLRFAADGRQVLTTPVAVGSTSNPTPTGLFYVTDVIELKDADGPWGPFALGLSARSETITEFNGGDGIIGIHGTNRPHKLGQAVSLGCVRVDNEMIALLADMVDLGVPVLITA
ncbi:MAG: L,D-transpeptidase [Actinomycetota bacterium]